MQIEGILEKIQDALEKRLLELNELRNVPILTYKQSDLESVLDTTVRSGIGIAILLMPPTVSNVIRHIRGPIFSNLLLEIKIVEDPATNRSGHSLLALAETTMKHLHGWQMDLPGIQYRIELIGGNQACQAKREDGQNIFIMRFSTPCHLTTR